MHSWIFRNRERLRVLFGLELPASPAPILAEVAEALRGNGVEESSSLQASLAPEGGPPADARARKGSSKGGTIRRTSRYVVIQPMPPLKNAG